MMDTEQTTLEDQIDTVPTERSLTVTKAALLKNGSDAAFRALLHNLMTLTSRLEVVQHNLGAAIGLSGTQYSMLISIAYLQGSQGVGIKALAGHLSLSNAFVTIEATKLFKLELVGKHTSYADRRRFQLYVTKKGHELLSKLASVQQEVNDMMFASLNGPDFNKLGRIMEDVVERAEQATQLAGYLTGTTKGDA